MTKTFAEFQIIGNVGNVKKVGTTVRIKLAANYDYQDDNGDWVKNTYWNEITIFHAKRAEWAMDNLSKGDLVFVRGTMRETRYEKDGKTVYGHTFEAREISLQAKAPSKQNDG